MIDAHCHLSYDGIMPPSFVERTIDNLQIGLVARGVKRDKKVLRQMAEKISDDPFGDQLVREMDEAGVVAALLLAPDFSFALRDTPVTAEENLLHYRVALQRHGGRFQALAGVDPRWGADGVALFERAVGELGFAGLKVYPPCGFSPSDPALFPYYEICAARGLPVLLHTGPTSPALSFEYCNPFLVDEAALKFPTVNFILAHAITGFLDECAMLCAYRPNVYCDFSAFPGSARAGGPLAALRDLFSRGINHKILFGSDWPVYRMSGNLAQQVRPLLAEGGPIGSLPESDRRLILFQTASRLLSVPAQAGGREAAAPRV